MFLDLGHAFLWVGIEHDSKALFAALTSPSPASGNYMSAPGKRTKPIFGYTSLEISEEYRIKGRSLGRSFCWYIYSQESPLAIDGVVTILKLSNDKMNMHIRHENELHKMLSQLSTESSKQTHVSSNMIGCGIDSREKQELTRGTVVVPRNSLLSFRWALDGGWFHS